MQAAKEDRSNHAWISAIVVKAQIQQIRPKTQNRLHIAICKATNAA
jgi:hypothetical protein